MPTTVYDLFASCICDIPVFLKKDKKIYQEIKAQLKLFGAEKLIENLTQIDGELNENAIGAISNAIRSLEKIQDLRRRIR